MRTIVHVAGARPNFVKVAALWHAVAEALPDARQRLVHTGQHYDEALVDVFLRDLALPSPHWSLGVGSGSHATQVARMMLALEDVCLAERPDVAVVVGDVNSTLAAALVAAKLGVRLAHVEAGLRSYDRSMPEEVNRVVTDHLADLLFTPSVETGENLRREGVPADRIHLVGNVMIDALVRHQPAAGLDRVRGRFPVTDRGYAVLTLHRPSNVDRLDPLLGILEAVRKIAEKLPVVFPVHPRTRARIARFGLSDRLDGLIVSEPLGYLDFLALSAHARVILTDSGGLQEESTVLGVPCLVLRTNTERPVTLTDGTAHLVGSDTAAILAAFQEALATPVTPRVPPLWDGLAATRTAAVLRTVLAA
jgi:UDP-N-acetylglucosamine 2-epimerase (non-hydrolysing)